MIPSYYHIYQQIACTHSHNNIEQSLQSKEKKEKNERKITALLMGKLQVSKLKRKKNIFK